MISKSNNWWFQLYFQSYITVALLEGDDARDAIIDKRHICNYKDECLNHHGWSNKHIQASQEGLLSKTSSVKEKIHHIFALQLSLWVSASARTAALCDFSLIVTTWLRSQSLSSLNTCMHVNIWAITVPMCSTKGSSWSFCTLARLRATPVGRCWEETVQRLSISRSIPHQHAHNTGKQEKHWMHTAGVCKHKNQAKRKSERLFSLFWALTWTAQQAQRRSASSSSLLTFHTPAPSWLPCEVGPSALFEVKLVGGGGRAGETWALSCLFVPLLILFLLFSLLLFSLVVSFSSWNSAPPLAPP